MEKELIKLIKKLCPESSKYIGDDCAMLELGEKNFLFCLDNFVENTHFKSEYFSPEDIGWKSLAVNFSDIAAMAGDPLYILVGLALNKNIEDKESWVHDFYTGLNACAAKAAQAQVIGGDICAAQNETAVSITVIGKAPEIQLLRSTAKPGDKVCVTGKHGNSAVILNAVKDTDYLRDNPSQKCPHRRPEPRLEEAKSILKCNSRGALMDTSDGLAQALEEISEQSQVDIQVNTEQIPRDKNVDLSDALFGGEDYELLACLEQAPPGFTLIGEVKKPLDKPKVTDQNNDEILTKNKIFNHF